MPHDRLEVFRGQWRKWHDAGHEAQPVYRLGNFCLSCGDLLADRDFRCSLCVDAITVVVKEATDELARDHIERIANKAREKASKTAATRKANSAYRAAYQS